MPKDPSQLVEYYDSLSSSYDQLYDEEQSRKHQLVLSMLGHRKWNILADVGCGTGSLLAKVAGNCGLLVGTDVSLGMLKATRNKLGRDAVELLRAHGSWLPLRRRICDVVLSVSVLVSENLESQISELLRVTRAGGTTVFTILATQNDKDRPQLGMNLAGEEISVSQRETLHVIRPQEPEQEVR